MDTKEHRKQWLKVAGIILLCLVTGLLYLWAARVVYENTANKHWQNERYKTRKNNPANLQAVDSCTRLLKTGDLVVRRGDDMTSYMLARLNRHDTRYSHCGIAVVENGVPYVYHSIGGEDNPDQVIRKDKAVQWCSPANNLAFAIYRYSISDSNCRRVVQYIANEYRACKMFDMDFDLGTDDRLYCSEMIYKAIGYAMQDSNFVHTENNYGKEFVGVDNLFMNTRAERICQIKFK